VLKKLISILLAFLLTNVAVHAVYARSQDDAQARRTEKVRENVRKLGVGPEARVEVKLEDGRKLKGHIREATEDNFVVVEEKTGTATTVAYSEVSQLKGKNGLTAAKVGLNVVKGVAIVAGVAAIFTLFMYLVIPRT
jgi:hypothetical protein